MNSNHLCSLSVPVLFTTCLAAFSFASEQHPENNDESKIWEETIESHPDFASNPFRTGNFLFGDSFEAGCWRAKQMAGCPLGASPENLEAPLWKNAQMQVWPEGEGQSSKIVGAPHPVRDGSKSMRLEWRRNHADGSNTAKKAMLHWAKADYSEGLVRWYAWSMFLPSAGASPDAYNFLIFQIHSGPDYHLGEPWRRPFLSLSIDPEGLMMTTSWDRARVSPKNDNIEGNESVHLVAKPSDLFDRWVDFVLKIRTSYHEPDGSIELWMNGVKAIDLHNIRVGHNDVRGGYPSFGIYRPASRGEEEANWLYLDAVRVGNENATYEEMTAHLPQEPTIGMESPRFVSTPNEGKITLSWNGDAFPKRPLQVERRRSTGRVPYPLNSLPKDPGWHNLAEVESSVNSFTDLEVEDDTIYHYRLKSGGRVLAATGPVSLTPP